jgi:hypothetical protein
MVQAFAGGWIVVPFGVCLNFRAKLRILFLLNKERCHFFALRSKKMAKKLKCM